MSIGLFKENETGAFLKIHLYDYIAKILIDNKYKYIYIYNDYDNIEWRDSPKDHSITL